MGSTIQIEHKCPCMMWDLRLSAVLKIQVFWDTMLFSVGKYLLTFWTACCIHLHSPRSQEDKWTTWTLTGEATSSFEMSVTIYQPKSQVTWIFLCYALNAEQQLWNVIHWKTNCTYIYIYISAQSGNPKKSPQMHSYTWITDAVLCRMVCVCVCVSRSKGTPLFAKRHFKIC